MSRTGATVTQETRRTGITVTLEVNGTPVTREVAPQTLLAEFIREHLRLTGTHVG